MLLNYNSSFNAVFQLLRNKRKYNEMCDKLVEWVAANIEKTKTRKFSAKEAPLPLEKIKRSDDDFALAKAWMGHCKVTADFIVNDMFDFTFQKFYSFILKNQALKDKEKFIHFLAENHAELSVESKALFENYFKDLSSKKYPDHLQFYHSLNLRLPGEDVETSKLMAALLFFQSIDAGRKWCSLRIKKADHFDSSYFVYLIASVLDLAFVEGDHVDEETFSLLAMYVQSLREKFVLPQVIVLDFAMRSLSNKILMKVFSSIGSFLNQINPNKYITLNPGDKPELCLIHLLKLIKDPIIFQNFMTFSFFKQVDIFSECLKCKSEGNAIKEIFDALCDATNENTKAMWEDIKIAPFYLADKVATARLNKEHPGVLAYPIMGFILYTDKTIRFFNKKREELAELSSYQEVGPEATKIAWKINADGQKNAKNIAKECVAYWDILCAMAMTDSAFFQVILTHDRFISFLRQLLMDLFLIRSTEETSPQYSLNVLLKHVMKLNEKGDIVSKIWSRQLFDMLRETKSIQRDRFFLLAGAFKEKYENELLITKNVNKTLHAPKQVKPVSNEDRLKENKQMLQGLQKRRDQQDVVVQALPKASTKVQAKKVAPLPALSSPAPFQLTPEQCHAFSKSIAAVVAGNPDIEIKWVSQAGEAAGYFMVNVAQLGNRFKIAKLNSPNYDVITLTDKVRDAFFNKYVPARLKECLGKEVSVSMVGEVLHIEPKKEHCSYPNDMHSAAFEYLTKHGQLAKAQQASLRGVGSQTVFKPTNKKKDPSHHLKLLAPANSLTAHVAEQKVEANSKEVSVKSFMPLEMIKQICCEITQDALPNQRFNFLNVTKDKEHHHQYVAEINLKGTACLSAKLLDGEQERVDTYIILKSIMVALQEKYYKNGLYMAITPDELNPAIYNQTVCKLTIKATKEKLEQIVMAIREDETLRAAFNRHVASLHNLANCYVKYNACLQEASGHDELEVMVVKMPLEEKEVPHRSYQHLKISNEQLNCLDALFDELKEWDAMLAQVREKGTDASLEIAIESAKFVCYHRIFHNVTWVLQKQNKNTEAMFMRTLRDVFRHGYLEVQPDFMPFIETWVALLMAYQKDTVWGVFASSATSAGCPISWPITQSMHHELIVKVGPFLQAKSNHAIGDESITDRLKTVVKLKAAIKEMEASPLDEAKKQSMILAMMSRIGEIDKTEKECVDVFGRLGTHNQRLTALPCELTEEVYIQCVLGGQSAKCSL